MISNEEVSAMSTTLRSTPAYHRRSYTTFQPYMDVEQFGSMMLLLRERNIGSAYDRHQAGADVVDIISCGIHNGDYQTLRIHSREKGDHFFPLKHTYSFWAQIVTLNEFLQQEYGMQVPRLNWPKKENGLLTCIELDDNHECFLKDRYIVRTFKLRKRNTHKCPEETSLAPVNSTVATLEHRKGAACAYCLAEALNINV